MKITLLYQVSHYIRVKKLRNIKSWDQQNYLVISDLFITRFHCTITYVNRQSHELLFGDDLGKPVKEIQDCIILVLSLLTRIRTGSYE